ncbi:MAG: endo-1,4-beta-xylanase [Thermoguttaceae bacterium]|jgi:endo-1,4-beta-xylanase
MRVEFRTRDHRGTRWLAVCGPAAALLLAALAVPSNAEMPESYRKTWTELRPQIDSSIERHRKSDATIEVVDAEGKPVPDASLDIRQKTQTFLFGCNILPLGQLGDRNEAYEQGFVKLFNLATTTFCWSAVEPKPGQMRFAEGSEEIWRRPPPDRVVAFGKKHGITLKGQPLLAGSWHPSWAPKDREQVKELYREWFAKVAERYGNDIQIFDVVNESQCHRNFCLYTPELEYVGWAFREAQAVFPDKTLLEINEGTEVNGPWRDKYFQQVKDLVDQGAGVESVGFQFHLFSTAALKNHLEGKAFPPSQLLETYAKFCDLGLPLFITEITIPTTLEAGPAGEAIQAEALANLYRLWFSVPRMAGIIHWNLADGAAWKSEGKVKAGLLDEYMCEKPAYQALYQLIKREWKTRLAMKTDPQGKAGFRGFHGKYDVTVAAGDRSQQFEIDLTSEGPAVHRLSLKP